MTLPVALQDRELQKFEEDDGGLVRVRTSVTGDIRPSGLNIGGRHSEVTINSSTWTALPGTALAARNAISIQNYSGVQIKINYADDIVGYVGTRMENTAERHYQINPDIVIYAKSSSGTVVVDVEEIA